MDKYLDRLVPFGQNVQQISRRDKVESRECESLCLEVLGQGLLTQR